MSQWWKITASKCKERMRGRRMCIDPCTHEHLHDYTVCVCVLSRITLIIKNCVVQIVVTRVSNFTVFKNYILQCIHRYIYDGSIIDPKVGSVSCQLIKFESLIHHYLHTRAARCCTCVISCQQDEIERLILLWTVYAYKILLGFRICSRYDGNIMISKVKYFPLWM